MQATIPATARVISRKGFAELIGLSIRALADIEANGEAPPRVALSARRVGYRLSDIEQWIEARRQAA